MNHYNPYASNLIPDFWTLLRDQNVMLITKEPIFLGSIKKKKSRPVISGNAGVAMAPPDLGRSDNRISIRGGRLCPPNNTGTPGFSDRPTALNYNEIEVLESSTCTQSDSKSRKTMNRTKER